MQPKINIKLKPFFDTLIKCDIGKYLKSAGFVRLLIKNNYEQIWQNAYEKAKSEQTYFAMDLDMEKIISVNTFKKIVDTSFETDKNLFDNFLFTVLKGFFENKEIEEDQYSNIKEDLKALKFKMTFLYVLDTTIKTKSKHKKKLQAPISKEINFNKKDSMIFISHSSKDKSIVDSFVQTILRLGLHVPIGGIFCSSIEGMGINTGEDFRLKIKEKITGSHIIILMLSQSYKESEICQNEMGAAWVLNSKVIPIVIPPFTFKEVGPLHITEHIDRINTPQGLDNIMHTITETLKIGIGDIRNFNKQRDQFLNDTQEKKQSTPHNHIKPNPGISIISATYEWFLDKKRLLDYVDVTDGLKQLIARGIYQGRVSPDIFGIADPIYGVEKTLKVHYKLNGVEKKLLAVDGDIFNLLQE